MAIDQQDYRELVRLVALEQAKLSSSAWFFTGEDALRLRVFNSASGVTVALEGRMMTPDGCVRPFAHELTPATDRTESTVLCRLGEGFLLNVGLRASAGTPRVGQCFATVEVVRGSTGAVTTLGALISGYVTDTSRLPWPGSPARSSVEGPGVIRLVTGTDPAAGAEISETVPTNAKWRLVALRAALVTDATVANRTLSLLIDNGSSVFFHIGDGFTQTAGLNVSHVFSVGAGAYGNSNGAVQGWLPTDAFLMGGYRIRTSTSNLQAADDLSSPHMLVEEWIED